MRRTLSQRNFFPTNSSGSSAARSSGSTESTNHESPPPPRDQNNKKGKKRGLAKVLEENAIVIMALRGCFMCVSVNSLVQTLGAIPMIIEAEEVEKTAMLMELSMIEGDGGGPGELPAVYVGGKLLGGVDKVMEAHIKGEFVPMLRAAGALWF